jgi:hypothetical protein
MEGRLGSHGLIDTLPGWTLLFAREPESDLQLQVTEPSTASGSSSSPTPQKPPRLRILVLIMLLLLVAGGAYVAMDPELAMKLMGQDQPPPSPPPPARMPARSPVAPPVSPSESATEMEPAPSVTVTLPSAVPSPLFGEGQHVIAAINPTTPTAPLILNRDAARTEPGPSIRSTDTLVVLDAELHGQSWVYFVRNDEGAKGWMAEQQLAAKP